MDLDGIAKSWCGYWSALVEKEEMGKVVDCLVKCSPYDVIVNVDGFLLFWLEE